MQEIKFTAKKAETPRSTTWKLYFPSVCVQIKKRKINQRIKVAEIVFRIIMSLEMGAVSFYLLHIWACVERGYQAYGGECLLAVAIGMGAYKFLKGGTEHGA